MEIKDFGIASYREIWDEQRRLQAQLIEQKKRRTLINKEYLLIGEHYPVYTLGFHGNANNLLINECDLKEHEIEFIQIERGGDITFHGPGQVIVYPIVDLERHLLGVKAYVHLLEESVLLLLKEYGIRGERIEGATGIWIGKGTLHERKICAIGVKISRSVSMHGLALNVSTDLTAFDSINPCGFKDKGVTSMQKELEDEIDIDIIKKRLAEILIALLAANT